MLLRRTELFLYEIYRKETRKINSMEIKFGTRPGGWDYRCFIRAGQPAQTGPNVAGVRLKNEFARPGRPEIIRTILLVDDDPQYLEAAQLILRDLNLKVVTVDPAYQIREQVIRLIEEHKPDLIVMDGEMPDVSGVELVWELREKLKYNGYIAANSYSANHMREMERMGADFRITAKVFFNFLGYLET